MGHETFRHHKSAHSELNRISTSQQKIIQGAAHEKQLFQLDRGQGHARGMELTGAGGTTETQSSKRSAERPTGRKQVDELGITRQSFVLAAYEPSWTAFERCDHAASGR
eukprot:m.415954 g.415954  ORF g.415954 m.415954 type:complete len:109 (-) comp56610_c0_seq1:1235-1561(-)